eukprot:802592-Prorocentrum_minimum.AAC.6
MYQESPKSRDSCYDSDPLFRIGNASIILAGVKTPDFGVNLTAFGRKIVYTCILYLRNIEYSLAFSVFYRSTLQKYVKKNAAVLVDERLYNVRRGPLQSQHPRSAQPAVPKLKMCRYEDDLVEEARSLLNADTAEPDVKAEQVTKEEQRQLVLTERTQKSSVFKRKGPAPTSLGHNRVDRHPDNDAAAVPKRARTKVEFVETGPTTAT